MAPQTLSALRGGWSGALGTGRWLARRARLRTLAYRAAGHDPKAALVPMTGWVPPSVAKDYVRFPHPESGSGEEDGRNTPNENAIDLKKTRSYTQEYFPESGTAAYYKDYPQRVIPTEHTHTASARFLDIPY